TAELGLSRVGRWRRCRTGPSVHSFGQVDRGREVRVLVVARPVGGRGGTDLRDLTSVCGDTMTWDEHYHLWSEVRRQPGQEAHWRLQAARKRVSQNTPEARRWLAESLNAPARKGFVAGVFQFQPVPRRLLGPMLHAAVLERNPSFNRVFFEPCLRSLGGRRV